MVMHEQFRAYRATLASTTGASLLERFEID